MRLAFMAISIVTVFLATQLSAQELKIPAFTAYLDPSVNSAHVDTDGITGWATGDHILWGGMLGAGQVKVAVLVDLPQGKKCQLKLTLGGQEKQLSFNGIGRPVEAEFGAFEIAASGYQRIELFGISKSGETFGNIKQLTLSGPAIRDARFNLKPRRNAASVHLHYPLPNGAQAAWFYNELTPMTDPTASYYEACGFSRGYFGIQVNSTSERRVIFSVWDSGNSAMDRNNVAKENRVTLVAKGAGVEAGSFGNEGTGGHSHLKYMWKTGETQKCLVTATVDGNATIYSGYFYFNDTRQWGLIASFHAPNDGKLLRDLYSFNEDFDGSNGHLQRLCEFSNQWIKTTDGKWLELTAANFSHDATGDKDRQDYGAGVTEDGRFFLSNGGFIAIPMKSASFLRARGKNLPPDVKIPQT